MVLDMTDLDLFVVLHRFHFPRTQLVVAVFVYHLHKVYGNKLINT